MFSSYTPTNPTYKYALYIGVPSLAVAGFCYYRYRNKSSNDNSADTLKPEESPEVKSVPVPNTAKTLKESGNKLFKIGNYAEALELYSKAVELCDEDDKEALEQLYQNRAAVFEKLGDYTAVIKETTAALKRNPKYVKALHRRSKAYKATGFLEESLEDITAVCILEQFSSPVSVQLADDVLKELGALEGARLMRARDTEGEGVNPSKHTCMTYLRGFYNCPISKILTGREELPSGDECPYITALSTLIPSPNSPSSFDSIIPLTTTQIETHPNSYTTESHYLRGSFRFLYGHTSPATLEDFEYVIKHTTDKAVKATALVKLASHYALVGQEKECEDCFEEAAKVWPDNVDLWHHKGQILLTRNNLPDALSHLSKAAELEPSYAIANATKWYVQYRILGGSGDIPGADQCVREFENLVRKFGDSPDVFSLYGQILMENQRFAEAELHFSRVAELDKTNAGVLVHRAMAKYQQNGDVEEAIKVLEDAVNVDERNEFVYETLGTLHLQNGSLDPAIKYITRAVKLARSVQELTILSSLLKAAEVQKKVRDSLGLEVQPGFFK